MPRYEPWTGRLIDHDEALLAGFDRVAVLIHHAGGHASSAGSWPSGEVRCGALRVGASGANAPGHVRRGSTVEPMLRLPPGVNEYVAAAHVLTQPTPRSGLMDPALPNRADARSRVILAEKPGHSGFLLARRIRVGDGVVVGHTVVFNNLKIT